ncbi:MAG: hypothetical protein WBN05_07670, partial [Woeseiaceae bacterium]
MRDVKSAKVKFALGATLIAVVAPAVAGSDNIGSLLGIDAGGVQGIDAGGLLGIDAGGVQGIDAGGLLGIDAGGVQGID